MAGGVPGVFANLPVPPPAHWCATAAAEPLPEGEQLIVNLVRLLLLLGAPCSVAAVVVATVLGTGNTKLVNNTDAYLPLAMHAAVMLWLVGCNRSVRRLVRRIRRHAVGEGGGSIAALEQLRLWPLPRLPTPGQLQSADTAGPSPTAAGIGSPLGAPRTAADVVRCCARAACYGSAAVSVERAPPAAAAQPPRAAPAPSAAAGAASRGGADPNVPEGVQWSSCAAVGLMLGLLQTLLIRFAWSPASPGSGAWRVFWQDDAEAPRFLYCLSTLGFLAVFSVVYTLLCLILQGYRRHWLRLRALAAMVDRVRSRRHRLPHLLLTTPRNLACFEAARAHLLAHCTKTNSIGAVLDPTVAVMMVLLLAAIWSVVVRQLFLCMAVDTLTKCSFSTMAVEIVYITLFAYYARRIEQEIHRHSRSVADARWALMRRELALRRAKAGEVEDGGITIRGSEATIDSSYGRLGVDADAELRQLSAQLAVHDGLLGVLATDTREPEVLGTALNGMRWTVVLALLAFNTVLSFAIREYHDCSE